MAAIALLLSFFLLSQLLVLPLLDQIVQPFSVEEITNWQGCQKSE